MLPWMRARCRTYSASLCGRDGIMLQMNQNSTLICVQANVAISWAPVPPRVTSSGVVQRDGGQVPRNSEKGVMKLSATLSGAVVLLLLALAAQAQGVGDAQRGAQVFVQCKICHSLEAGKNMVGPSLHGLFGRKSGSVPGFAYSPAMKNVNVTWNDDTLSKYLADPKAFVPGDKMVFLGIKDPSKLGDLLAYLNQATR